jgi:multiple sugar transport system permease protein
LTETISIYAYIRGFQEFDTSYIAAVVVLLMILFSAILVFTLKKMEIAR